MAASDNFAGWQQSLDAPARAGEAVTPSDTTPLTRVSRGLYVGGAGNVAALMADGDTPLVFTAVPAGSILPICCRRINSTNTTATTMVALY
jgi:hypothetical protein